jgi:hypothetical protein
MSLAGVAPEDDDGNAASIAGDGGKRFERTAQRPSEPKIPVYVTAAMTAITMCNTTAELATWKKDNAEAIGKMPPDDADEIVRYFNARIGAVKEPAAPQQSDQDTGKTVSTKTLADRAALFESALKDCRDQAALRRTYEAASRLRDDLDKKDPERLAELNAVYEQMFDRFEPSSADTFADQVMA